MKRITALLMALVMMLATASCAKRIRRSSRGDDGTTEQTDGVSGDVSGALTALNKVPDKDNIKMPEPTEPDTAGHPAQTDEFNALYGGADTTAFTVEEMSIRLPKAFSEEEYGGFDAVYYTEKVAIFVIRQGFDSEFVDPTWTVEEYAEAVIQSNSQYSYTEIDMDDGYALTTHTSSGYFYLSAMYKSDSAFWYYQFACEEANADALWTYAVDWLETATYN